ncbi:hypothetical protein MNBD_GAMMA10-5 [hydrothermal vent metagenome]|uniref:HTH araC/xylS-type domain-containing protein n=1 Tax=hydrothermal vent metagenome TaxID=652676 RepID=A0A3B0YBT7_9ZZZZ
MSDNRTTDLDHLGFRKYMPAPSLADYIESYWFMNVRCEPGSVFSELLHPDGGMGFVFNYGSPLKFDDELLMGGAFLNGPCNQSMCLTMADKINAVGIRFKPAGAHHFMAMPLNELKNSFIPCADKKLCNLNDYFYNETNDLKKVQAIDSVMFTLFATEKQVSSLTLKALTIVKQHKGMLEINKLASLLDANQRKLERVFKLHIGVSPAEYSSVIKISHARTRLKNSVYALSDISFDLGFYDQAHFSRQFKSVVGISPGAYRQQAQLKR